MLRSAIIVLALVGPAYAHPNDEPAPDVAAKGSAPDDIVAAPPTYKANGVTVDEHLGAKIPGDARFTTQDGKTVTLAEVISGELPTILTFNYSDCPMLCSLQLTGLVTALPKVGEVGPLPNGKTGTLRVGAQFRIVTIDLEPKDTVDKLAKMRARYIDRLPEAQRADARTGWTFLHGDEAAIRRVADAVGFKYTYIPERAEWAHPAALIFLSTTGAVTRYVYGIEFEPPMMRESIFKAGLSEASTAVGFMNRCYHYDPDANSHVRAGVLALRIGAAGFVVLMLSVFGLLHWKRRHTETSS